jgi:hypothetical protein
MALKYFSIKTSDNIPLFWGFNAVASTLGAMISKILPIMIGFKLTFFVGLIGYLIAGISLFFYKKNCN